MGTNIKDKIISALETQREIFGDELYDSQPPDNSKEVEEKEIEVAEKIEINFETSIFAEDFQLAETLDELNSKINTCTKCSLSQGRTKFVFGTGNPDADVMLIGEAPGAEEDKQGIPFVGRAGQLLNDILKAKILPARKFILLTLLNVDRREIEILYRMKWKPVCRIFISKSSL